MSLQRWHAESYRGYTIRTMPYSVRFGAYVSGNGNNAWFEGSTVAEVREKIDAALGELPDPVQ